VIWGAGVEVFKKHPFGGVGAGNFNRSVQGTLGVPWSAHSIFVQTAAEEGVVGLALLGALLLAAIGPVWKRRARGFLLHTLLFLVLVGTTAVANFVTLYSLWFGLALVAVGGAASAPAGRVAAAQAEVSGETRRGVLRIGTAEDWG
jgi:O-antigen ligase